MGLTQQTQLTQLFTHKMAYHYKGGKVNEVKSYKIVTETGKVLEYTRTKAAALELIKPLQKIYGKNLRIEKIE